VGERRPSEEEHASTVVTSSQGSERRARHASIRRGRHRTEEPNENFARGFNALGELALAGVQVSARATDLATGKVLFSVDDHVVMPTASIGKVLLLVEVASRLVGTNSEAFTVLDRAPRDSVGDSGIWQHMQSPSLPLADLAALIGATSDNLATNVLIRYVGLEAVRARTEALGLTRTALLDLVRDHRGPDDAPQLSIGSAKELTWLFASLARGEVVSPDVSQRVVGWLSLNSDLSMVASAFGLDPLAHRMPDHGVLLMNKTGTDGGVRSEVGVLRGPRASVAYAVSMYFADTMLSSRLAVLDGMHQVGLDLLEYVH
jgi:beta-lactamase class A